MRPDVGSYQFEETFNRYLPPCSCVKSSLSNTPFVGIRETCSINGVFALACDISRFGLPLFSFINTCNLTCKLHSCTCTCSTHVQCIHVLFVCLFGLSWQQLTNIKALFICWFCQGYINNCMAVSFYCGFLQEFWRLNRSQNFDRVQVI